MADDDPEKESAPDGEGQAASRKGEEAAGEADKAPTPEDGEGEAAAEPSDEQPSEEKATPGEPDEAPEKEEAAEKGPEPAKEAPAKKDAPRKPDEAPKKDEAADGKPEPKKEATAKKPEPKKADEEKEAPPRRTMNEDTQAFLGEQEFYAPEQVDDIKPKIPAFKVPREKLVDALRYLRDILHYEHLACITAIDWKEGKLEVVYNLWSYSKNRPLAVRVDCTVDDPVVPSVTSIWTGAAWLEREEYDLMGIHFEGNADLRRILLPEGWKGHPLRKDYDWKKEQFVGMDRQGNDVVYQEAREDAW